MPSVVLVLNCGSSSIKFALIDPTDGTRHVTGMADRVGSPQVSVDLTTSAGPGESGNVRRKSLPTPSDPGHAGVLDVVLTEISTWLTDSSSQILAVGHRVAHGGEVFDGATVLDPTAVAEIRNLAELAPLHNPANLTGIEAAAHLLPDVTQVAVFDTAFHQTMPPHAYRYAVPQEWYTEHRVRRYGFHGTSHGYVSAVATELLADLRVGLRTELQGERRDQADAGSQDAEDAAPLRLLTAHLGNGCSLAAILGGRSVDTSMGLTPLEGVVMGTRSGDVDPGLPAYLSRRTGLNTEQITTELNQRSGLLALSGRSNDMREIQQAAEHGDERARLALDVFSYRLAKAAAALMVPLGGLDALVFTGGIGENSAPVRAAVVQHLSFLGWRLDQQANAVLIGGRQGLVTEVARPGAHGTGSPRIGPGALVVPTDEEFVIAREAARLTTGGISSLTGAAGRRDTVDEQVQS